MKHNKYTVLSFLGMLALSVMLVSCYSLWDDLSAVPKVTITYVSEKGTPPAPKQVNVGHKLTAADLPNIETDTEYGIWDKAIGTEITADTTITATNWEDIVYLKNFKGIWELITFKSNFEKTVFTEDTYTGDTTNTIGCADDINNPGYFTGVISSDNKVFTIYGNGHRIFAPVDSSQLFSGFNKLSSIEFNNFYTSKVTNMNAMLSCEELTSLDLSSFNTSNVTDMSAMFEYCEKLQTLDLSSFNTEKVINMKSMFEGCEKITVLDISSFDSTSLPLKTFNDACNDVFKGCSSLVTIYSNADFQLGIFPAFGDCSKLVGGAGTACDGTTNIDGIYARIDGGPSSATPGYFTLKR